MLVSNLNTPPCDFLQNWIICVLHDLLMEKGFPWQNYSTWTKAEEKTAVQTRDKSGQSHLCRGPYMSWDAVGTMLSVPRPRGDVCKWVRLILHVGLFACQILSLIIRGQRLHEAHAVPKDVFRRLCETEKQRLRRCGVPLKSNPVQILQRIYSALELGLAEGCRKNFAVLVQINTHFYF